MDENEEKIGRTPSDAAVEFSRSFLKITGAFAPYIVVIALLSFGFLKYLEQERSKIDEINAARIEAEREQTDLIRDLKDQILSDTATISNLQSGNLDLINKQIESQKKIIGSVTENLDLIGELSEKNRRLESAQVELEDRLKELSKREAALQVQARELEVLSDVAGHIATLLANDAQPEITEIAELDVLYIARKYEGRSADHVGRDQFGNYYYGPFRISADTTFAAFENFVFLNSPNVLGKLQGTGGVSAAIEGNDEFVNAWKQLSKDPRFIDLQAEFIFQSLYEPAVRQCVSRSEYDPDTAPIAVRVAIASSAVQHGSTKTAELCELAMKKTTDHVGFVRELYRLRRVAAEEMDAMSPEIDTIVTQLLEVRYVLELQEIENLLSLENDALRSE